MRVLLVEDDLVLQGILADLITKLDESIELETATSADEIILIMKSQALNPNFGYDLIISDVKLNGEATGFDLWNVCSYFCPSTFFVFIAGLSTMEFVEKLQKDPRCPPFLTKPFKRAQFARLLEQVMEHKGRYSRKAEY